MSGSERGKEERLYYDAQKLYVEELMNIPQVQARLKEDGEYVSEVSLRKWKKKGDWDRLKQEYRENVAGMPDLIRDISVGVIQVIAKKHAGDINTADLDMLAKAQKLVESHRDPRDELKVGVRMMRDFLGGLKEKDAELAMKVAPHCFD